MIEYIKCIYKKVVSENIIMIEWNGLGLRSFVSMSTMDKIPNYTPESEIILYVFPVFQMIKEKLTFKLFSTLDSRELILLKKLLSVSGIGNKNAFTILGSVGFETILMSIIENKPEYLIQVSGIGKRTAARIILELQESLSKAFEASTDNAGLVKQSVKDDKIKLLVETLYGMGAKDKEIKKIVETIRDDTNFKDKTMEYLLKYSLKLLGTV